MTQLMSARKGVVTEAMKKVVPTFRDPETVNSEAERSKEMQMVVSNSAT